MAKAVSPVAAPARMVAPRLLLYIGLTVLAAAVLCAPASAAILLATSAPSPPPPSPPPPTGPLVLEPLPYSYDALEPVIATRIMQLHHDVHEAAYVTKANAALAAAAASNASASIANMSLPEMLLQVGRGTLDPQLEVALRNNGGGHWNHQLFWQVMSPPGSSNTSRSNISPALRLAIDTAFGSTDNMLAALKTAGDSRFGSGWSWLCVAARKQLQVLSTPNQDNPLMRVVSKRPCIPILGLDVWEHAYYLQYGPSRTQYTTAWLGLVNWARVSANYAAATRGRLDAIGSPY